MKQNLIAYFDSVDMATLALQRVRRRCGDPVSASVRYAPPHPDERSAALPALFHTFFPPYASGNLPNIENGPFPETLMLRQGEDGRGMDHCKTVVRLTLEQKNLKPASAVLRQYGGYGITAGN